jgi:serine/threonine protein kinase
VTTAPKRQPIPFGKYLLLDRVNIGGMAEVWRAKTFGAGGFERLVAIKRILPNIAEDEEFISMFIDEAKITVQLNHANVAQIYELSHIASSYFIAMEYISGKDMRAVFDRCRKRGEPAPVPLTCYIIAKCCEGLDYAHRKKDGMGRDMNIVHRDVSPQNALLSFDGEVKVIDFGIAKAAGKATKTQAGILKGKFGYMSPEQIRGLPLDRRSDVFAIGVCLYEMLTGERLFVGDSDFSVLEKVRKVEVLPPSHFNRKIPDSLEKIVMKSLAKDVDERYTYASELGDDLQRFLITSDNVFGRKDLAAFMKATFAEDVEKEKQRLQEYTEVKAPEGMLALAEMGGFGVGAVPGIQGVATNASAVTSVPTMVPPSAAPVLSAKGNAQTTTGLPQVRPVSSPVTAPPRPTGGNMPRLTAAAPAVNSGKEEHESTMLVDGAGAFDGDTTNPGNESTRALPMRNARGEMGEIATDPGRPALAPAQLSGQPPRLATNGSMPMIAPVGSERPGPPMLVDADGLPPNAARRGPPVVARPGPPVMESARGFSPVTSDTSPTLGMVTSPANALPSRMAPPDKVTGLDEPRRGGNGRIIAGIVVALLVLLSAGGYLLFGRATAVGLLMFEFPDDVHVEVSVNGKALKNDDGSAIDSWPQVKEVPAGKVTVMVKAKGYDTIVETIDVKSGTEYTKFEHKLKKKGASE